MMKRYNVTKQYTAYLHADKTFSHPALKKNRYNYRLVILSMLALGCI